MPIAAMARARAMRANAFPGFVTDDVMCYRSPNRRENADAAAWYRSRALLYNKKFSVYRSRFAARGRVFSIGPQKSPSAYRRQVTSDVGITFEVRTPRKYHDSHWPDRFSATGVPA